MDSLLRRRFLPLFALAVFALLAGCGNEAKTSAAPKGVDERFPIKVGRQVVQMQVAILPDETQKGLMYRKSMGAEEGMVFVFDQPREQGFWMRNCDIPLDIGYFDGAGELKEIYPMYPHDERTVASRSRSIQFCLEMNQGWYSRNAVKAGDKLDLGALAEAIRARGFKPEDFGLR
jgi:uncharacterized membrane protein (UPF0127 family)